MRKFVCLPLLLLSFSAVAQFYSQSNPFAHTYSIVARDEQTGEMAVGVQSHWYSVGTVVTWGQAGVGVVATQSFANKAYGYQGLELMKKGKSANEALQQILEGDQGREVRQVAMIDTNGNVAAHTGNLCIDYANHITGKNYSVQSNMMLNNTVCAAMAGAFEKSAGQPLAERILLALNAAQKAGGDIRGKQSAALLVVAGRASQQPWDDRLIDLRVDDHAQPLAELDRLLKLHRAYDLMNKGDWAVEQGDMNQAMEHYNAAMKMFPANLEMQYWTAITLANGGDTKKAVDMLKKVYLAEPNWRELTKRLPKVKLLNVTPEVMKELVK